MSGLSRRGDPEAQRGAIRNEYSRRAAHYGSWVPTYHDPALVIEMLTGLELQVPIRALDLGAGRGDGAAHLRAVGAQVVSLDLSPEMLKEGAAAETLNGALAKVYDLRSGALPFGGNSLMSWSLGTLSTTSRKKRSSCLTSGAF